MLYVMLYSGLVINNFWKRLTKVSWFVSRLRQIINLRDTDKSRYFALTEFNNCFIIWLPSFFFSNLNHPLTAPGSDLPFFRDVPFFRETFRLNNFGQIHVDKAFFIQETWPKNVSRYGRISWFTGIPLVRNKILFNFFFQVSDLQSARVVFDVSLLGRARKVVTLRSALMIKNKMDLPLEIKLQGLTSSHG